MQIQVSLLGDVAEISKILAALAEAESVSKGRDTLEKTPFIEPAKKGREPKETEPQAAAAPAPAPEPAAPAAPPVLAIPSEKEVQDALVAVNDKKGIDAAIACLTKFGVKRGRELREDQRAEFVKVCKEALN